MTATSHAALRALAERCMETVEHAPSGPWEAQEEAGRPDSYIVVDADGMHVATVGEDPASATWIAEARDREPELAAAVLALLDAQPVVAVEDEQLREAVERVEESWAGCPPPDPRNALDRAGILAAGIRSLWAREATLRSERDEARAEWQGADGKADAMEAERDAYRAMVCDLLASASPHPTEHPTMSRQWARARELLKNGASASASACATNGHAWPPGACITCSRCGVEARGPNAFPPSDEDSAKEPTP